MSTEQDFKRVGVIGGGTMGAGIAEVIARAGDSVLILERDTDAASAARARIKNSLSRAVKSGRLDEAGAAAALGRIDTTLDIGDFADRQLVIEAAPEIEAVKIDLFKQLDKVVAPNTVLATNTSSIPVIRIAKATSHPERVVGVHFFNPVPVLPLVEIVVSLATAPQVADEMADYAQNRLGKKTIRTGDKAGFVVNALLVPYLINAIRMFESGFADKEDIDAGMIHGCGHPMGPLRLSDTIGLDVVLAVTESLYSEFREQQHTPPPLLRRMVEAGHLGKKTGQGFYTYP
ncbi:3-hydroxybutyryl-CoA dehydrogenase [Arthrobacter globiformis]|uniref:3-hydroxybutyryl-CoA dehydrogenase n=1 Tax=Arthrobacter globiformis TaxID=1665 RepID=UPI0027905A9B|nr:3-hydroxybutyryl-CoA dehydrogenase [Arthrobacter globiformis]MDQ0618399.1 3-hydroxybutyryl-CoA dehydrogenase [Arthrobacter globiformis]